MAACEDVECSAHGSCTARLLGGSVHVSKHACVCEPPWGGPRCDLNPCEGDGISCGAHGSCSAVGDKGYQCDCDEGWSGENCDCFCSDPLQCQNPGASDLQLCLRDTTACSPNLYGTYEHNGKTLTSLGAAPDGFIAYYDPDGLNARYDFTGWCVYHNLKP